MKRLLGCSLLSLVLLSGCDAIESITGPEESVATLSGRVTMESTGSPYYPASVALWDSAGLFAYERIDTDGRYRFRSVRPGFFVIVVTLGERTYTREAARETIEIKRGANVRDFVVR